MKHKRFVRAASVVGAIVAAATLIGAPAMAHEPGGHGPWGGYMTQGGPGIGHGHGMGRGHGMGHGMMGFGHGMGRGHGMMGHPGMMGRGGMRGCGPGATGGASVDKELSVEDVTKILEGRLAWRGNDRLKVGKVVEKDEKTIIAEIVTVDDSLVKRLEFDRRTGAHRMFR